MAGDSSSADGDRGEDDNRAPIAVPFEAQAVGRPRDWLRRVLPAAVLLSAFLAVLVTAGMRISHWGGLPLIGADHLSDRMSESERDELSRKFYANGPVALEAVKFGDLDKAIASMELSSAQEAAFRGELATLLERDRPGDGARLAQAVLAGRVAADPPPGAPSAARPSVAAATPGAASSVRREPDARAAAPTPVAAQDAEIKLPLAWVTLWDFRDEDGDVVRVVSSGYTRLVPILHQPVTLAMPAPPNGVINVIGVHDGYGGITVGIESGAVPLSLPVLVEGQIVGVPVAVR